MHQIKAIPSTSSSVAPEPKPLAIAKPAPLKVLVIEEIPALREHLIKVLQTADQSLLDIATTEVRSQMSAREVMMHQPDMITLDLSCGFAYQLAESVLN